MKLEQAKALLKGQLTGPACLSNQELKVATSFGVEALGILMEIRARFPKLLFGKLPGETP